MKNWTKYAFIRLVVFLILGIIIAYESNYFSPLLIYFLVFFISVYCFLTFFISKSLQVSLRAYRGIAALIITFLFAWINTYNFTYKNHQNHFIHHKDTIQAYVAIVDANIKETAKTYKTELSIQKIKVKGKWVNTKGRTLAYFKKEEGKKSRLKYGNKVLIKGSPQLIQKPLNPQAFDYREYLYFQNIYHQHFIYDSYYKVLDSSQNISIQAWASNIRQNLDKQLQNIFENPQSYAVSSALILGVKDHLDYELKDAYAGAGMMHILAVSGLHVGIVMIILQFLFKKVSQKSKSWEWIITILIILFLWVYAFLTGLSPSVLRASTMFSIILLSKQIGKNTNIYNTIALSAFVLLMLNPFLLYSVSFQLSYIAVIGIVYLQPKINAWFWSSNKIISGGWNFLSVSIAAQIATFALGLYYFHQFPNFFFISNLVVLPAISFILGFGLLTLLLSGIPYLGWGLGWLLDKIVGLMNLLIFFVSNLPLSVSSGIYISALEMFLIYAFIIFFLILLAKKKFYYVLISLIMLLSFSGLRIYRLIWQHNQSQLTIYHIPKTNIFQITQGKEAYFLSKSLIDKTSQEFRFNIEQNYGYLGITKYKDFLFSKNYENEVFVYQTFEKYALLVWNERKILVLQDNFYQNDYQELSKLKVDFLIVQNNAIYTLDHLPKNLKKAKIIVDASNYYNRQQKLLEEAKKLKLDLHFTSIAGAFVIQ